MRTISVQGDVNLLCFAPRALDLFRMGQNITIDQLVKVFPDEMKGVSEDPRVREKLELEGRYRRINMVHTELAEEILDNEQFKIPNEIDYKA